MRDRSALRELARGVSTPLPVKPLLVPWVHSIEIGDGLIELRAEETFYPLRHPILASAFRAVEDRLAGEHEVGSITSDLPRGVESATVVVLLKMLRSLGLLLDADELDGKESARREQLLFLSHFTVHPALVESRLGSATVELVGTETLVQRVANHLRAAGCQRVTRADTSDLARRDPVDLLIACTDAPARGYLSRINDAALGKGQRWLRVAAHGRLGWLGPLVIPGQSACFACMQTRERANARGESAAADLPLGSIGAFAPHNELLAAHAATEAVRFLGGMASAATIGRVYELSAVSPRSEGHVLLRDPHCLACGSLWLEDS